jgi:Flp pilus assembly protein TadG
MSRHISRRREALDGRGSISVWLALASTVMILLVGLAVDLGGQVHAQQRAHDLAAQAARAGGEEVQAGPAIAGQATRVDAAAARAAALRYLAAAGVDGQVTITGGDTLTVTVHDTYQARFLGLVGLSRLEVTGTANAHLIRTLGGTQR